MNRGYNLKPRDWDKIQSEWQESLEYISSASAASDQSYNTKEAKKKRSNANHRNEVVEVTKHIDVICEKKHAATSKARFFITNEGIEGVWGFWCPKSAIIAFKNNSSLEIKDWVTIREIEWNEN